ncbi:LysR family transcriptional regulator [Actinomadura sp. LD22]|uniref:LysR family transcriptional regulator n=1 Tax=Actinomadura physcomitrii TaxID=2650748 RepID=A0A6I4MCQ3_9ACTN|nr:LysR family transcriptional regulator [Actinomadura physcomitrii]MVZ99925.1 LysR family transcriptional regulator [Actinomadura physcomitrii]
MDLRLLRYFRVVVDQGSITKAAEALYIAQPSLSQAIRTLERQLGVQLFDRSGRRLVLTAAGKSLAAAARTIESDVERARAAVRAVRDLGGGRLELAATATLEVDPLPELAGRLRREHPGILLSIVSPGGAVQVVDEVRHGRAEIGLIELPARTETLRIRRLKTDEITLVLPPALAEGLPDPVPLDAVAAVPLVIADVDAATMPVPGCQVAVECAHRQAVWDLVRLGAGATFLPRHLAETQLRDVVIRSLCPHLEQDIGLVFRSGELSPAARAFMGVAGVELGG